MSDHRAMPGRTLHVQLIANDNGFGLSRDLALLGEAIRSHGHEVSCLALGAVDEALRWKLGRGWRARRSHWKAALGRAFGHPRADINIMFEHLWPAQLGLARRNIALPNPEWFDTKDARHLGQVNEIWAKTRQTEQLFATGNKPVHYIGFSSEDCHDPAVPRRPAFFHLAGGSPRKGTERLLALWRRHPEWPLLTVVQRHPVDDALPSNIHMHHGYLELTELRHLQNSHLIHLCPSEAEGYGHYLVEAMSVGAVVVTTDASPMNELVTPLRGRLVSARPADMMGMVRGHHVEDAAMETVIDELRQLSMAQLTAIGQAGRQWFLANQRLFHERVGLALLPRN